MPQLLNFPAPATAPPSQSASPAPAAAAPADATGLAPLPFNLFFALAEDVPADDGETVDGDAPEATLDGAAPVAVDGAAPAPLPLPSMSDSSLPAILNFLTPPPAAMPAPAMAGGDAAASLQREAAAAAAATATDTALDGAAGAVRVDLLPISRSAMPLSLASLLRNAAAPAPAAEPAAAPANSITVAGADSSTATAAAKAPLAAILPAADSRTESALRGAPQTAAPQFSALAPAAADMTSNNAAVRLPGNPDQWQQPLRDALGDRLQLQLQRNSEQATIRLDPPNLGRIEISIRHSAGALQVNLSASNNEVLRQLNAIGDNVRQDLSQRQYSEVNVTVSATPRGQQQGYADGGQGRQQGREQQEQRAPGRALSDGEQSPAAFAMSSDRE